MTPTMQAVRLVPPPYAVADGPAITLFAWLRGRFSA